MRRQQQQQHTNCEEREKPKDFSPEHCCKKHQWNASVVAGLIKQTAINKIATNSSQDTQGFAGKDGYSSDVKGNIPPSYILSVYQATIHSQSFLPISCISREHCPFGDKLHDCCLTYSASVVPCKVAHMKQRKGTCFCFCFQQIIPSRIIPKQQHNFMQSGHDNWHLQVIILQFISYHQYGQSAEERNGTAPTFRPVIFGRVVKFEL